MTTKLITAQKRSSTDLWLSWRTMQDMMAIGLLEQKLDKVQEDKFGQMAQCMRDGGKITRPMELVDLSTQMVTFMMDNGLMIKHTGMACTVISMAQNMKAHGKKINNTVSDSKPGQMVLNTMDNTFKVRSMVKVLSHGLTVLPTTENLLKTIFKEMENIIGQMVENMMVHG